MVRINELGQQEVLKKLLEIAVEAGDYETYGVHIGEGENQQSLYMKASSILNILYVNHPDTILTIGLVRG
jgi:hypothetical protein